MIRAAPFLREFPFPVHALGPPTLGILLLNARTYSVAAGESHALRRRGRPRRVAVLRIRGLARHRRARALCRLPPRNARSLLQTRISRQTPEEVALLAPGGVLGAARCVARALHLRGGGRTRQTEFLAAPLESSRGSLGTIPPTGDPDRSRRRSSRPARRCAAGAFSSFSGGSIAKKAAIC